MVERGQQIFQSVLRVVWCDGITRSLNVYHDYDMSIAQRKELIADYKGIATIGLHNEHYR